MVVSTRSTPIADKEKNKKSKMKRKLSKKGNASGDDGEKANSVSDLKMKGKAVETGLLKKRKLNFDVNVGKMEEKSGGKKEDKSVVIRENTRLVKNWEYLLPPDEHYSCRITIAPRFNFIETVKQILTPPQLELFRGTFLGHFLDLKPLFNQPQFLHSLLLREVKHPNDSELWLKIAGYKLRFSIEEFAVITGLNCVGDCNMLSYSAPKNRLVDTYFPTGEVTRDSLGFVLMSKAFKSDEDAVKLAVIYVYECFLFSNESKYQNVNRFLVDMVDSGDYNSFPWGILVFRNTIADMKNRVFSDKRLQFYRLNGFPLALQLWFYEVCPATKMKICLLDEDAAAVPRMLKWYNVKLGLKKKFLNETFFNQTREQLKLKNIVPSPEEKSNLNLSGFFQTGKTKIVENVDDSSDDDQILGDFLKLRKGESSKQRTNFSRLKNQLDVFVANQKEQSAAILSMDNKLSDIIDAVLVIGKHLGIEKQFKFNSAADDDVNLEKNFKDFGDEDEDSFDFDDVLVVNRTGKVVGKKVDDVVMTDLQDKNNAHMDADVAKDGDSVSVLNFVEVQSNAGDKTFNKDDNAAEKPVDKDVSGPALTDSAAEKLFDKDDSGPALTDIESDGIVKDLSMGANLDSEENEQEKEEEGASDKNEKDDHDDKDDKDDGDAGGNAGCNTGGKADGGGAIGREDDGGGNAGSDLLPKTSEDVSRKVNEDTSTYAGIDEITPQAIKRTVKPSRLLQSPFLAQFSSGDSEIKEDGDILVVSRLFPFDSDVGCVFMSPELVEYESWIKYGALKIVRKNEGRYYKEAVNKIEPPFDFGVDQIDKKDWFYALAVVDMPLANSHLDVLFYYLRKKGKYDKSLTLKFTTTDSYFDQCFQSFASIFIGGEFNKDLMLSDDVIGEYMKGNRMRANTAWKDCEIIFIPFHVKENNHWVLLVLNLRFRRLSVLNSMRTPLSVSAAKRIATQYAIVLPYFLDELDVFKLNTVCDMSSPFYISQGSTDPLDLVFEDSLPHQEYNDCGIYVYSFAEYTAYGKEDDLGKEYYITDHRRRLSFGLYNYGNWKNMFNITSSSEIYEVKRKGKGKAKHIYKQYKGKGKAQ